MRSVKTSIKFAHNKALYPMPEIGAAELYRLCVQIELRTFKQSRITAL